MSILKKIFLLVILVTTIYTGDWGFKLPELKLKPESNSDQRLWVGSHWLKDSTNYMVFNTGGLFWDSLRVIGDLYVGKTGGKIYLDTLGEYQFYASGYAMYLENTKTSGTVTIQSPLEINLSATDAGGVISFSYGGLGGNSIADFSSSGLVVRYGDIQLTGGTQQIKVPTDTVSDYDSDDAVTINRQSGIITTKSLTTAGLSSYTITLTNSLIVATSKVFAIINDVNETTGVPIVRSGKTAAGSCDIVIYNAHASVSFNNAMTISFIVWN